MADGVAPADLYPLDIPRALAKLDTIKDDETGGSQVHRARSFIGSGEVAMSMIWNGRGYSAKQWDGKPVEMQWNQRIPTADYFVIPKGSMNKDAAMEFIARATCANNNAAVSAHIPYGPTNVNAEPNAAVVPDLAVSNVNESTAYFDDEYLVNNFDAIDGPSRPGSPSELGTGAAARPCCSSDRARHDRAVRAAARRQPLGGTPPCRSSPSCFSSSSSRSSS